MIDFTTYIPKDRLHALAGNKTLPDHTSGAALFADVSGFTPLTQTFAQTLGKKRGAEALLSILNPLFEALIEPVHRYGGSIIGFAGDAITCWFDDHPASSPLATKLETASLRAVAAALAMQSALAQFATVPTPAGTTVSLSTKIGIAAGSARRFLVGDPTIQRIDTLAGTLLLRMAAAEKCAKQGEVIVSREVALHLGDVLHISSWRDGEQYAVVEGLTVTAETRPWPPLSPQVLPAELSRQWMLPSVYEQLRSNTGILGDLRPVTPLMLSFGGIDFDTDDDAGDKLNAFISWVQHIIHHHGGVLLELTIGDKGSFIYAPFGAPQAHENDPARAMQAALALRELPPDLASFITPLKIGLARGEVWTGNCGGNGRFTYGVMGSDVSLAARLMSQAQPGQILVSGRMSQYPGFQLQHIGDLTVKGFDQPLSTYSLLGELLAADHIFSTAMIGRTAELSQLVGFAQPIFAGKLAGTAIIYGEAGIGKSRLAYALRQRLTQSSAPTAVSWFRGQTDQILRQAFNPFVYWLRGYFNQSADDSAEQNKTCFTSRIAQTLTALQALDAPPQRLLAELTRTQSFLGALLGLRWDDSLYQQLDDPRLRYQNTLTAVKTLLLAESCLHPVVFELEDGHWLDESSRDVLLTLSRNVATYPLLIVITSRYHDDGSKPAFTLDGDMPTLTLDLDVLTRDNLEEQATAILAGPIDPTLLTLLWERSRANPFFVEQILLHFQEMGALVQTPAGAWGLETTPSDLPADVNAMLIARIDRLAQQVKQVVQVAAVLGREFDVQLLSNMLRADVLPEVEQAESEQIWALLHELRYIFKHALLRDAAYEMQLSARLRELHLLAATTTEQVYAVQLPSFYGTLAYHYHSAYQLGAETALEKSCEYLRKAGEAAQKHYNNMTALAYYAKLLPLLTDEKEQIEIHLKRGKVLALIGEWADAENEFHAALAVAAEHHALRDHALHAEAQLALGELCRRRGAYDAALDWVGSAQSTLTQLNEILPLARVLNETSSIWENKGDYDQAQAIGQQALALARQAGDNSALARALGSLGDSAVGQGDYATAKTFYIEALAHQRMSKDKRGEVAALNNLGRSYAVTGDNVSARPLFEECVEKLRTIGDKQALSIVINNLGNLTLALGDYAASRAFSEESLTLKREMGDKRGIAMSLNILGNAIFAQGDYAAARALYEDSLVLRREIGDKPGITISRNDLGIVMLAQGDYDGAQALFEENHARQREIGDRHGIATSLFYQGLLAFAQGDYATARAFFAETLALSEEMDEISIKADVLLALGLIGLAESDPEARQGIMDSLRLHRKMNAKHKQTSGLIGMAEVALQEGDPHFAAQLLGAAESALQVLNAAMEPEMIPLHAQTLAKAKETLGEEAFNAARTAGSRWSLEEAVAFALKDKP